MAKAKAVAKTDKVKAGQCEAARKLIRQGKTNQQTWDVVRAQFKKSRLGVGGVGWLRNELRVNGEKVKTNRELTNGKKPAAKAKKAA